MKNDIAVMPNYISKDEAEYLINFLNAHDHTDENWGSPCFADWWRKIGGDPSSVPEDSPIPDLLDRVTKTVSQHFLDNELSPFIVKGHKHIVAASTAPNGYKDYAAILFLNEEYEGGRFIMPDQDVYLKPDSGSLIVFKDAGSPSAGRNPKRFYGVSKVTAGQRYSITFTFYAGGVTDIIYDDK